MCEIILSDMIFTEISLLYKSFGHLTPKYSIARCRAREKAVTSSQCGFRGSLLVNQAKSSYAVTTTTIFTAKPHYTKNITH